MWRVAFLLCLVPQWKGIQGVCQTETLVKIYKCTQQHCVSGFTEHLAAAAVLLEACLVGEHVCSHRAGSRDCPSPSPIPSSSCRAKQPLSDSTNQIPQSMWSFPWAPQLCTGTHSGLSQQCSLLLMAGAAPVPHFAGKAPACQEAPRAPRDLPASSHALMHC